MSHLNYNHLYYFWMVCKQGSVTKAADALFLTPQTVTGQIKALEERLDGKLTKRNGRNIEPTELGQLVYKYADRMFGLSYEISMNLLIEIFVFITSSDNERRIVKARMDIFIWHITNDWFNTI